MLLTVSIRVSPLLREDEEAEKLTISADKRFSANSKERRVRVEFSKNKLAMVISLRDGTFFMGLLITDLKLSAVWKIKSISSSDNSFIPTKCLTLKPAIVIL